MNRLYFFIHVRRNYSFYCFDSECNSWDEGNVIESGMNDFFRPIAFDEPRCVVIE